MPILIQRMVREVPSTQTRIIIMYPFIGNSCPYSHPRGFLLVPCHV